MSDEPRTNTSDLAQAETPRGDHDAPADTSSPRRDRDGAQAGDAHDEQSERPERKSKIFGPHVKVVDRTNYINRIYDAPDEEWSTWRMSADGKTRLRY